MTSKEIILNDIIEHLDLLINNEPIGMELSKYIECLKDDILFLFKSLKKEKPTLTEAEKIILGNIDKKYKYITRDEDNDLYIFVDKPIKDNCGMWRGYSYKSINMFNSLFKFIEWTDDEPYLIEDLLKEGSVDIYGK